MINILKSKFHEEVKKLWISSTPVWILVVSVVALAFAIKDPCKFDKKKEKERKTRQAIGARIRRFHLAGGFPTVIHMRWTG